MSRQGFIADQLLGDSEGAPRSLLAITVQFVAVAMLLNGAGFPGASAANPDRTGGHRFIFGLMSLLILSRVDPGQTPTGPGPVLLILFGWSLVVDAHIYRHALSIKLNIGVLLAVLIFAANFVLLSAVFG